MANRGFDVVLGVLLLVVAGTQAATPPANAYQTANFYTAAYRYVTCTTNSQAEPTSTQEVAALVSKYQLAAQSGSPVTMRTSRPKFHSTATFVCPVSAALPLGAEQTDAIAAESSKQASHVGPTEVAVMQTKLNKVLAVDPEKYTMRVGPGMTIRELMEAATENKMSVQIGSFPVYAGLTLGGVLATSAHGSGDQTTSSLADTVLEVTWVDGTGKIHTSKKGDPEFAALNGGLGVFGLMTELLIQLTPPSNTQLITVMKPDTNMMAEIEELLKISPHILIHWRPDSQQFKAFMIRPAPASAEVNYDPKIEMSALPNLKGSLAVAGPTLIWHTTTEDDSEMMNFVCPETTEASMGVAWATLGKGYNGRKLDNVTAPTNQLQSAECEEDCPWNDQNVFNSTAMDAEFTIDFSQLSAWVEDVKEIFNQDLKEGGKAKYRCMGLGHMWIRFGQNYDGVTATPTGIERPVYVQSTWMRSHALPHFPMRYQFVVDLVEELTLCKYKGRPHWGKNFDRTFLHPKCPIAPRYPKFNTLVGLSKKYDPAGLFKPRLFDRMAAQDQFELFPQCAALMKCYCNEDIHCRPEHKCVPSLAFPEYKVCKPVNMADNPGKLLKAMMDSYYKA